MSELRQVLRSLLRAPGFVLVAALTLAVGIGSNVSVYALIDAVLFRPITEDEPDRLVRLASVTRDTEATRFAFSYPDYRDIRERAGTLGPVAASSLQPLVLRIGDRTSEILGEVVSGGYFGALRHVTSEGRLLTDPDDKPGAAPVAVISRRVKQRFFVDRDVLGTTVFLNGVSFTIVGVAPERFNGTFVGAPIDVWVPLEVSGAFCGRDFRENRTQTSMSLIARLASGVTRAQADAEVAAIGEGLSRLHPSTRGETRLRVVDGDLLRGGQRRAAAMFALVLSVLVGLVLLIVCANVANLLLARGVGLRRQMAVRLALGASRARVMRLVMLESLVLALLGGTGAVALAASAIRLLSSFDRLPTLTIDLGLRLDPHIVAAAGLIALVAGVLLGVAPAMHASRPDLSTLREDSSTLAGGRRVQRARRALVVAQIAVSLLLLAAAGIFLRSLANARALDLGFRPEGAMAIDIDVSAKDLTPASAHRLFDELHRRLRARADVDAVAFSNRAPVDISTPVVDVLIDSVQPAPGEHAPQATMYLASPEYFEVAGIPLLQGRAFRDTDRQDGQRVAIVNEEMARRFWSGQDAIGRQFRIGGEERRIQIVGIARNSRYRTLGEEPQPHVYLPFAQSDGQFATVLVRTNGDPRPFLEAIRRELERLPTPLEGFFGRTLLDHLRIYLLPSELAAGVSATLGAVALLVAAIGLYGVIAYMVIQRRAEIAVRMALGADAQRIRSLVIGDGVRMLVPGLLLGVAGALALGRLAANFLYGVHTADPPTLFASVALLTLVVLFASWLPARRAVRMDPVSSLRV